MLVVTIDATMLDNVFAVAILGVIVRFTIPFFPIDIGIIVSWNAAGKAKKQDCLLQKEPGQGIEGRAR